MMMYQSGARGRRSFTDRGTEGIAEMPAALVTM